MFVFSTQLCELSPSLWFNSPRLLCVNNVYTYTVCVCGGGGGMGFYSKPQTDKHPATKSLYR
jgi:hypothetical protein